VQVGDKYLRPKQRHNGGRKWEPVYVVGETRVSWIVSPYQGLRLDHPAAEKRPKKDGMPPLWARDEAHAAELDACAARSRAIERKLRDYSFRPTDAQLEAIARIMGWEQI
jgi:hypothetical protein